MNYWLFKSEPDEYGIEDLKAEAQGFGVWDGIRNFQARNLLRDQVQVGDRVFIYHSSCKLIGIVGIAEVVRAAYPDPNQFNPESRYFDAKASDSEPRWYCVDIRYQQHLPRRIALAELKRQGELQDMVLLKQGRLSIQPVTDQQWQFILQLAAMPG